MTFRKRDLVQLPDLTTETAVDEQTVEQVRRLCQLAEENNEHCIYLASLPIIKIRDTEECITCLEREFFSEEPADIKKSNYVRLFLKAAGLKIEKLERGVNVTFSNYTWAKLEEKSHIKKKWRLLLNGYEIGYVRLLERDSKQISMIVFDFL